MARMKYTDQHQEERVALCPDCGQEFDAAVERVLPSQGDIPDHKRMYECPDCGCKQCRQREDPFGKHLGRE
jgi:DNA-directed RNA polymerase subunit RPC12/RpoP